MGQRKPDNAFPPEGGDKHFVRWFDDVPTDLAAKIVTSEELAYGPAGLGSLIKIVKVEGAPGIFDIFSKQSIEDWGDRPRDEAASWPD